MNLKKIYKIAKKNTPTIEIIIIPGAYRYNVIDSLKGSKNIGIELGVAEGGFSKKMVDSGKFSDFYGVDMYADTNEYKVVLSIVGIRNKEKVQIT